MNPAACKAFFDDRAPEWDSIVYHDPAKIAMIIRQSGIRRGDAILDIGTGTGVMLPHLREAVGPDGTIIALDISEKMIEIARQKYGTLADDYLVMNFFDWVANDLIDIIMAYSCFPHFGDHAAFFEKARRLLKKGGRLVIAHSESKETINSRHDGDHVRSISMPLKEVHILAKAAEQAGFTVLCAEDTAEYYLCVLLNG